MEGPETETLKPPGVTPGQFVHGAPQAHILISQAMLAVQPLASVACSVNRKSPATGEPLPLESSPVAVLSEMPVLLARQPEMIEYVYGPVPPVAVTKVS
jgi:hypothetical protein